jgi:hypothetical protein
VWLKCTEIRACERTTRMRPAGARIAVAVETPIPAISARKRIHCCGLSSRKDMGGAGGFPTLPDRGVATRVAVPQVGSAQQRKLDRDGQAPNRATRSSATPASFAQRTRQMRSSAMRDLMAITARPEVISLAGGLPDTSTFPTRDVRRDHRRGSPRSRARARSSTGPPRLRSRPRSGIAEVMAAEGMRADPTTCS